MYTNDMSRPTPTFECIREFENIVNWVNKINKQTNKKDSDLQKMGEEKLFISSSHKYCFYELAHVAKMISCGVYSTSRSFPSNILFCYGNHTNIIYPDLFIRYCEN